MNYTFKVEKREGKIKDDEMCMGVVAGAKMESVSLKFNKKEFAKLFAEAGTNSIIALEGLDEPVEVTIQKVSRAPFTNEFHHVDFYALERGVEMNAEIPLTLVNEAGINTSEAVINQTVQNLPISCRPSDLIQEIEVDMSVLNEVGDTITVADLTVPKGITVNLEPEATLFSVAAAKEEVPDEDPEPVDAAAVPTEGEEKSEDGGESEEKSE